MANDIIVLDDITLDVKELKRDEEEGTVYIEFDVASEDYHNLSEHLYKEEFLVRLLGIIMRSSRRELSTIQHHSITCMKKTRWESTALH